MWFVYLKFLCLLVDYHSLLVVVLFELFLVLIDVVCYTVCFDSLILTLGLIFCVNFLVVVLCRLACWLAGITLVLFVDLMGVVCSLPFALAWLDVWILFS